MYCPVRIFHGRDVAPSQLSHFECWNCGEPFSEHEAVLDLRVQPKWAFGINKETIRSENVYYLF